MALGRRVGLALLGAGIVLGVGCGGPPVGTDAGPDGGGMDVSPADGMVAPEAGDGSLDGGGLDGGGLDVTEDDVADAGNPPDDTVETDAGSGDDAAHEDGAVGDGTSGGVSQTVDTAGGVVIAPDGTRLEIPPGALDAPTVITIDPASADVTAAGGLVAGASYTFGPDGQTFAKPVTITMNLDPARLPPDTPLDGLRVFTTPFQTGPVGTLPALRIGDTTVQTATTHFSTLTPGIYTACGPADADGGLPDAFDQCGVGCPGGYHDEGTSFATNNQCGDLTFLGLSRRCVRDTRPAYSDCNTVGCNYGYHLVGRGSHAECLFTQRCEVTEGPRYDTCEFGCAAGYHSTGRASLLSCDYVSAHCERNETATYDTCDANCGPGYVLRGQSSTLLCDTLFGRTCALADPDGGIPAIPPPGCAADTTGSCAFYGTRAPSVDGGVSGCTYGGVCGSGSVQAVCSDTSCDCYLGGLYVQSVAISMPCAPTSGNASLAACGFATSGPLPAQYDTCESSCDGQYYWAGSGALACPGMSALRCVLKGASVIDACGTTCPSAYHSVGAGSAVCPAGSVRCVFNNGTQFDTCDANCPFEYHTVSAGTLTCPAGSSRTCVQNQGTGFDACGADCPGGYHVTGAGALGCAGVGNASVHCEVNVCSLGGCFAGAAADGGRAGCQCSVTCPDGSYAIVCNGTTCDCQHDGVTVSTLPTSMCPPGMWQEACGFPQ